MKKFITPRCFSLALSTPAFANQETSNITPAFGQSRIELEYTGKSGPLDLRYLSPGYLLPF